MFMVITTITQNIMVIQLEIGPVLDLLLTTTDSIFTILTMVFNSIITI